MSRFRIQMNASHTNKNEAEFTLLTWNVDGLDSQRPSTDMIHRAAAVCESAMSNLIEAVFL